MKKILTLSAVALLATLSNASNADVNPWQECGLGAMVFPDNGPAAAISNIIWDLGTTAVTSASASEESCEGASAKTVQFILESYDSIETEIVQGEGEHITAMLDLFSCDSAEHQSVTQEIRNDAADTIIDSNDDSFAKAQTLHSIVTNATASCSAS